MIFSPLFGELSSSCSFLYTQHFHILLIICRYRYIYIYSHEIKRRLLLERKAMTNLDSRFKSRDITLPTKVHLVKAMVFLVVSYGYESWTIKKAECWRIDDFELLCWRRLLRVTWTARRSSQSILKEINPKYSLDGLILKLKLQCFWPPDAKSQLNWKRPWCWDRSRAGGKGDNRGWGV